MSDDLKPCPFCGGPASLRQAVIYSTGEPNPEGWFVLCPPCDMFPDQSWNTTRDKAIAGWNTRTSEAAAYQRGREDGILSTFPERAADLKDKRITIEALQAENARLREALEATNKLIYTARDKVPEDDETILSDIFAHYLNHAAALINAALKETSHE